MIADCHHLVRRALRVLLEAAGGVEVVGEASDGAEAVERVLALKPDVMLLDLAMPKLNGIEVARRVRTACPRTRVLALTALEGSEYVRAASDAGALGYLPKTALPGDLMTAIRTVARGRRFVHPLATRVGSVPAVPLVSDSAGLSLREADVIRLLAMGYTNKEVAMQLDLSVKTVETYKSRAGGKIGRQSRADLVRFAVARGWLTPVVTS